MKASWPLALIILGGLGAIIAAFWLHADPAMVVTVVTSVFGALLYGKVEATYQQTNGNTSRLIELAARQSDQLATMLPSSSTPSTITPPPGADTPKAA